MFIFLPFWNFSPDFPDFLNFLALRMDSMTCMTKITKRMIKILIEMDKSVGSQSVAYRVTTRDVTASKRTKTSELFVLP